LDEALESRLEEAARLSGEPVSSIIRQAIEQRCEQVLGERLDYRLTDVAGLVRSSGGRARHTGDALRKQLRRRGRDRKR
jgi:predicted transcriptional regulator